MASLDYRLKPLFSIKECSSCGSLYTRECCSIGSLENKILVPEPDSSPCCAKCGTPVDGPYCRGCALLRKKFEEDLLTYCVENGIFQDSQDTFESSDDNTNVINAFQEPIVVNQEPGIFGHGTVVNYSQSPLQINHNCCYKCGDLLDGIFCQQCTCKSCGNGAYIGYIIVHKSSDYLYTRTMQSIPLLSSTDFVNVHLDIAILEIRIHSLMIPNLILSMILQVFSPTLHKSSLRPTCVSYVEILLIMVMIVHRNSRLSMNRSRVAIKTLVIIIIHKIHRVFSQQYLCCANCEGPHYDYQCQLINETYYEPNPSYDSSGFDQPQPPQDFVDSHGILQALNKMQKELEEIKQDRRKKKEDMSIEEMRHEQQLVDYKIKDITNDLGYKRFRGEKIDEEYERDCEIRIRKLKQRFNELGQQIEIFQLRLLRSIFFPRRGSLVNWPHTSTGMIILYKHEFDEEEDDCYDDDTSSDDDDFENIDDPEFESFHFDLESSSPRPPPEPPDICLNFKPDTAMKFDLNQRENVLSLNVEDVNSFTFVIRTFLLFLTYPEASPLFLSFRSEDFVFDLGIVTF
ncbi:hypothetical protein Tco_1002498 [Tanacetum coccineum]|uniref:Uncharacterized protein n=1 Tax=Tanacetum coccineum TaxID=301880 RepID=A0ABQ5F7S6_9ASTR